MQDCQVNWTPYCGFWIPLLVNGTWILDLNR